MFENECVAASDCGGQEPQRNHRRKVERGDSSEHTSGLAQGGFVNASGDVFYAITAHEHWNAGAEIDAFDTTANFTTRFITGLAVFFNNHFGNVFETIFNNCFEAEQILNAVQYRSATPFLKACLGCFDGCIDISTG